MSKHAMDFVTYKLNDGVSVEDFMTASQSLTDWLKTREGFVARRCGVDENGVWADTSEWTSLAALQATSAAFMQAAEIADFISMFDPTTLQMHQVELEVSEG
ncbi:MAG: hypothetical protein N4A61_02485 [Pelagimonas sp.]|jgi:hypothetical protein|nr:hypothetical protein [Pelagimonas sp.]